MEDINFSLGIWNFTCNKNISHVPLVFFNESFIILHKIDLNKI